VLHAVVDGETGDDGSAGAVNVQVDGLGRVLAVKVQHDADHLVGELVIDFRAEEDDPLPVEAVVNVDPAGVERRREREGEIGVNALFDAERVLNEIWI
jgi:hypothetical protein